MSEGADFHLIVEKSDPDQLDAAAPEFAKAFSLDPAVARQVLKGAPILFLPEMTKAEVKASTPVLQRLSTMGVEFRITCRGIGDLPRVNWPVRPQLTAAGSGSRIGISFDWSHSAFVCPSCGETYLFQRMGKLPLAKPTATSSSTSTSLPAVRAPAPKPATRTDMPAVAAPPRAATPAPRKAEAKPPKTEPEPAAPELEVPEVEGLEAAAAEAAAAVEKAADPGGGEVSDVDALLAGLEPSGSEAKGDGGADLDLAGLDIDLGSDVEAEGLLPLDGLEAPGGGEGEGEGATAEAGGKEAPPGEGYNVFVSQVKDKSKRGELAKLIMDVRGCDMKEANSLTTRTMFMAAKNVPKEVAEEMVDKLKRMKISARMTKST